jgi:hypothetical protein
MSRALDISGLPQSVIDAIESLIRNYRKGSAPADGPRELGWAKEYLPELPASFFEPLPPDILDQFEGRAA